MIVVLGGGRYGGSGGSVKQVIWLIVFYAVCILPFMIYFIKEREWGPAIMGVVSVLILVGMALAGFLFVG